MADNQLQGATGAMNPGIIRVGVDVGDYFIVLSSLVDEEAA